MIKTAILTIAALSTIAGATISPSIMPDKVSVIAGALSISQGPLGAKLSITPNPDFAITITTHSGRNITIRF